MKAIGIGLVILGVVALIYGGVDYNREKTIFKMGGMTATATEHHTFPIPAVAGVLSLIGGAALLIADRRHA